MTVCFHSEPPVAAAKVKDKPAKTAKSKKPEKVKKVKAEKSSKAEKPPKPSKSEKTKKVNKLVKPVIERVLPDPGTSGSHQSPGVFSLFSNWPSLSLNGTNMGLFKDLFSAEPK